MDAAAAAAPEAEMEARRTVRVAGLDTDVKHWPSLVASRSIIRKSHWDKYQGPLCSTTALVKSSRRCSVLVNNLRARALRKSPLFSSKRHQPSALSPFSCRYCRSTTFIDGFIHVISDGPIQGFRWCETASKSIRWPNGLYCICSGLGFKRWYRFAPQTPN